MTEDERTLIDALLKHYSYKTGDFTLASGLKSTEYIDVKTALLHPCAGRALMVATCREALAGVHDIDCFAGVAVGAVPLASGVSQVAWEYGQLLPALIVRMEAKAHGTARSVDGEDALVRGSAYSGVEFKTENKRTNACVLLEDVITTGGSTIQALQKLERSERVFPSAVIAVLDREQGGIDVIKAAYPHLIVRTLTRITRVRQAPALHQMPEWGKMGQWMRLRPSSPQWPLTR